MAEPSRLNIEEIFFPILEMHTQPDHDLRGDRSGTVVKFGSKVSTIPNQPGKYAFGMSVATNNETSRNLPYRFQVEAYAVVSITGDPLEGDAAEKFIEFHSAPILMGAIRQKLGDLTSGAPWGRFLLKGIPLAEARQIVSI